MIRFILVFFVLFASCSKREPRSAKQTVRVSIQSEPVSLDPRKARDLCSGVVLRMLFEGLMRVSKEGVVEPALAEKVERSDDGLNYVFHLRQTNWSNGSPLTASDFLFAWKMILNPGFPTDVASHLFPIKNARQAKLGILPLSDVGIEVLDPLTLIVTLETPTPYFLELLTMPAFFPVPEKIALNNDLWTLEADTFVSNGPFQLKRWTHADQLLLVKNQKYWEEKIVRLDAIDLMVASSDTGLRCFEEGGLDWMGSPLSLIPTDSISALKSTQKLQYSPFLATGFCRLNVLPMIGEKENPLSRKEFRKALAKSLDRSSIVEHLLRGGQTVATSLVPREMGLNDCGYFNDNSLGESVLPQDSCITISYCNNERSAHLAQTLQRQWQEKLGIVVEIESVEPKIYFQRISRQEYQIAIGSWTADFNDPINFLEVFKFKDNGMNNTGWENLEYIDLLNESALCRDVLERKEILRKAEALLMEEMPIIPLYHFAQNYVKNDALTGVSLSPQGHLDLRWASFKD